jgi:hypothetical protein
VLSILGWFVCPIVLHIVGWVLANQSLATIKASGDMLGGGDLARAARIISIAGLVVYALGLLLFLLGLASFFAIAPSVTSGVGNV